MNWSLKILLLTLLAFGLFIISANATLTTSFKFTDSKTGDVLAEGILDNVTASNVYASIFIVPADKSISDIDDKNDGTVLYVGAENLDLNGGFSHTFRFAGEPKGDYKLIVYVDGALSEIPFSYWDWEFIESEVLGKIKDGTISGAQIYDILQKYCVEMDIDVKNIISSRDKNILIKRVSEKKSDFDNNYEKIIEDIQTEITLLNGIRSAVYWSVVEARLKNTSGLTGISFDEYDKLSDKAAVCNKIKGKTFADYNELVQFFNKTVAESKSEKMPVGNPSPGGGGGFSPKLADGYPKADIDLTPGPVFSDIADYSWAAAAITYLYDERIINGVGNGLFMPEGNIKREEFVKMCVLAFQLYDENAECDFEDVDSGNWAYRYIASAVESGIINGVSNSGFGFSNNITRQEIAAVIYRYKSADFAGQNTDFSDFDDISGYARDAVSYLAGKGIINGMGDGRFAPNEPATRAQAAKMLYQTLIME